MQIAVHDYQSTERVGALDIDEVSGAVRYLEGPAELEEWAARVANGFYTTRSHCTADCCDLGTWINLPWQREFSRQLGRQLIHMHLCTEILASIIRNHLNSTFALSGLDRGGLGSAAKPVRPSGQAGRRCAPVAGVEFLRIGRLEWT